MNLLFLFSCYWRLQCLQTSFSTGIFEEGNVRWCLKRIRRIFLSVGRTTTWFDHFYPDVVVWHCMYICHVNIIYSGLKLMVPSELAACSNICTLQRCHYKAVRKRVCIDSSRVSLPLYFNIDTVGAGSYLVCYLSAQKGQNCIFNWLYVSLAPNIYFNCCCRASPVGLATLAMESDDKEHPPCSFFNNWGFSSKSDITQDVIEYNRRCNRPFHVVKSDRRNYKFECTQDDCLFVVQFAFSHRFGPPTIFLPHSW